MAPDASDRTARIAFEPLVPVGAKASALGGTARSIREILDDRELLGLLVRHEILEEQHARRGVVWSLFRPIVQLLTYSFAIGQILGILLVEPTTLTTAGSPTSTSTGIKTVIDGRRVSSPSHRRLRQTLQRARPGRWRDPLSRALCFSNW